MSDNWVVQNLENALNTWNEKLAEVWQLITQSPESFKGGAIWAVVRNVHGGLQAVGLALLVLFFVTGIMKTCGSLAETKRPEVALKLFIRFALAKGVVTYGMELMVALFNIVQGVISSIMSAAGFGAASQTVLPPEIVNAVEDCGFFEPLGGDIDRRAVYHSPFLCDDHDRVRALFQAVPVRRHRTGAAIHLRRGAEPERGAQLSQKLCRRVFGRRNHRAGLHHFLCIRCDPAHD